MNEVTANPQQDIRLLHRPNKRQRMFIEYWLQMGSDSFGNAYQSAIRAGFSEKSARVITGNSRDLQWVRDAKELYINRLTDEHIITGLQQIAGQSKQDRDRLRALELLAKIKGMFIERSVSEVNVQFTNSVPRPVVDVTGVDTSHNV